MSQTFSTYEQDFCRYINSIRKNTAGFANLSRGEFHIDLKEATIHQTWNDAQEAEKSVTSPQLKQMEIEATMMQGPNRTQVQLQVRKYRDDFDQAKRNFRREEQVYTDQKGKETLMGSRINGDGLPQDNRVSLLSSQKLAAEQGYKLHEGVRVALEVEGVAIDTMNQLKVQRDKITHASANAREVSDNLSQGNRLINTMTKRAFTNKLITLGLIGLLIGAIGLVLYFKVFN